MKKYGKEEDDVIVEEDNENETGSDSMDDEA